MEIFTLIHVVLKKRHTFKALLHFRHALYNTGIVLIVFVSLRAFI